MDWERTASIAIVALCMTAIGVSATTLDSTVSQTPDDIIDVDQDRIPLGDDSSGEVGEQIDQNKQAQERGATGSGQESQQQRPGDGQQQPAGGDGDPQVAQQSDGSGTLAGLGERLAGSLLDLLPIVLALVALALAYRYRERLLGLLLAPVAAFGAGRQDSAADQQSDPWGASAPADEVDRAWYAMVRRLDVDQPWTKTPDECRAAAVDAGLDPDAVGTLTRVFREKRYAGDGPAPRDRERARQCLDRLDFGGAAP